MLWIKTGMWDRPQDELSMNMWWTEQLKRSRHGEDETRTIGGHKTNYSPRYGWVGGRLGNLFPQQ